MHLPTAQMLPLPPLEMRHLVGSSNPIFWDQKRGQPVYPSLPDPGAYDLILDFGCGCGRMARRLALAAAPMPKQYVGIDLHAGMIDWCNRNLRPHLPR